jgi:hypothetical protein
MASNSGAIGTGALDTNPADRSEFAQPARQRAVARAGRRERGHTEDSAVRVERRHHMAVQLRVDSTRDRARRLYDDHAIPFLFEVVGWHARPAKETVSSQLFPQPARSPSGTGRATFESPPPSRHAPKNLGATTRVRPDHKSR